MEYLYSREIQEDGRYNISYPGEKLSLGKRIYQDFPYHSIFVKCTDGDVLITMSPDLLASEKTTLDGIISTHKSNLDPVPSLFSANEDAIIDPKININHYGLHRQDIIDENGWLIEKRYYKNFDGSSYSNLAIKDEYLYTVNSATDLVSYRVETITWYLEDGNVGYQKSFTKYYDLQHSITEGVKRRSNLIDKAKTYGLANITGNHEVSGEPIIPNSFYFFNIILDEVETYIAGTNKEALISVIQDSTESFITQQIKDDLTNILQYWA